MQTESGSIEREQEGEYKARPKLRGRPRARGKLRMRARARLRGRFKACERVRVKCSSEIERVRGRFRK